METLLELCNGAQSRITPRMPDGVVWILKEDVKEGLVKAVLEALQQGVKPVQVFDKILKAAHKVDLQFPRAILSVLVKGGLHLDDVCEESPGQCVIHQLFNEKEPPRCRQDDEIEDDFETHDVRDELQVYLEDLLKMKPDVDLKTAQGETALHIMVRKAIQKEYFLDHGPGAFYLNYSYRDDNRASWLSRAFPCMIEAGFKPLATDGQGRSVVQLLREGYLHYSQRPRQGRSGKAATEAANYRIKGYVDMQKTLREALELINEPLPAVPSCAASSPAIVAQPGGPASTAVMTFGKHRGELLKAVPVDYVEWMCNKSGLFEGRNRQLAGHLVDLGRIREVQGGWEALV